MQRSRSLKRILHWVGAALGAMGVIFVVILLLEYREQISFSQFTYRSLILLLSMAVIYASACTFLALAWRNILIYLGTAPTLSWAIGTYGVSQIAKYAPGNVMHFAGRQAIGQSDGIPVWLLVKSTLWEVGLGVVAGCLFGFLVLPYIAPVVSSQLALLAFVVLLIIVLATLRSFWGQAVAKALALHVLMLSVSALIFVVLLASFGGADRISIMQATTICGVFAVSWLGGFVTPGAPAGTGVREALLLIALKGTFAEADLLVVVLLSRLVTVGGDLLFFLLAMVVTAGSRGQAGVLTV